MKCHFQVVILTEMVQC